MLSTTKDNLFSCLTAVAFSSNTMLKKNGESGLPGLVADLRGKAIIFVPWNMILTVGMFTSRPVGAPH